MVMLVVAERQQAGRRENSWICTLLAGLFGGRAGKSETSGRGSGKSNQTEASVCSLDRVVVFSTQWLDPKRRSFCAVVFCNVEKQVLDCYLYIYYYAYLHKCDVRLFGECYKKKGEYLGIDFLALVDAGAVRVPLVHQDSYVLAVYLQQSSCGAQGPSFFRRNPECIIQ